MKKRRHAFAILTGLVGLLANILAIARYLRAGQGLQGAPGRGLLALVTFILLAYGLCMAAVLIWRWTRRRSPAGAARVAALLLNSLAAFPLLALWLTLVLATLFPPATERAEIWLIALALAWIAAPFLGLGLAFIAEVLGPLMVEASAETP